jgi:hypothetical protein
MADSPVDGGQTADTAGKSDTRRIQWCRKDRQTGTQQTADSAASLAVPFWWRRMKLNVSSNCFAMFESIVSFANLGLEQRSCIVVSNLILTHLSSRFQTLLLPFNVAHVCRLHGCGHGCAVSSEQRTPSRRSSWKCMRAVELEVHACLLWEQRCSPIRAIRRAGFRNCTISSPSLSTMMCVAKRHNDEAGANKEGEIPRRR